MHSANQIQANILAKAALWIPLMAWAGMVFTTMATTTALAATDTELEGIMQGVTCVHYKTECPDYSMAEYVALEKDFVLLLPDGEHYFLPNLDRAIKARYAGEHVRITGKLEGHGIWLETLEVKKEGDMYKRVWRWKDQRKLFKESEN